MISNTTNTEIGHAVTITLTNPIDIERMYTIIYSGLVYSPFRIVSATANEECTVTKALDINQLIKYLDIRKEFNLEVLFKILPNGCDAYQRKIHKL